MIEGFIYIALWVLGFWLITKAYLLFVVAKKLLWFLSQNRRWFTISEIQASSVWFRICSKQGLLFLLHGFRRADSIGTKKHGKQIRWGYLSR